MVKNRIKVSVLILVMVLLLTTSVSAEWTTRFVEDERKENGVWYAHSPAVKIENNLEKKDYNITSGLTIGTDGILNG